MSAPLDFLRPDQGAILAHPARIKVVACGRRWGKSVTAGTAAIATATLGGRVAWVVPYYKNARLVWRFIEKACGPIKGKLNMRSGERTVEFPGPDGTPGRGGSIAVYTADNPDTMRGESFDLVVIDEAARIAEEVWLEVIQPTLADRGGKAIIISTPNGLNWFWDEWERGNRGEPGYASWSAPTFANPNPNIQADAAMAATRLPETVYRQEWLAEFLDGVGSVFRNVDACAILDKEEYIPGRSYVAGVDLASSNDYTVVVVLDVTDPEMVRMVNMDRYTNLPWPQQLDRISNGLLCYHPDMVQIDRTGLGNMPFSELANRMPFTSVWGINFNAGNKMEMVQNLAVALERQNIRLLDDPTLKAELKGYEAKRRPNGAFTYSAPAGRHDDIVVALMLAYGAVNAQSWGIVDLRS